MNTLNKSFVKYTKPKKEDNASNLRAVIGSYLYHWPLFLLILTIALILAVVYAERFNDVYSIKTKLLIENEKKTSDAESERSLDAFDKTKAVENEMQVIKSRRLMEKIVWDRQLWATYDQVNKDKTVNLYGKNPVRFNSLNPSEIEKGETFEINIKSLNNYILKRKSGEVRNLTFADTLNNQLGKWKLEPLWNLNEFIGSTIRITIQVPEDAVLKYSNLIDVKSVSKLSSVIEISLDDDNLVRGKDILNLLVDSYNQVSVEQKQESAKKAVSFIDSRLSSLKGELSSVEENFEGFRSSQGLTNVTSEADLFLQNQKSNDDQLNEVNVKLHVVEGIERYINSPNNGGNPPPTVGVTNPSLENLINQLSALQLKRDQLLATTPETNPDFDQINRPIASIKSAIKDNISGIKTSLLNVRNQLETNNRRFSASIKKIPGQEREYLNIKRQQVVKENLYLFLLQQREQADLSFNSTFTNNRKVDFTYQKSNKKSLVYGFAIFLGLFLPAGLIFTRDLFNNKVSTRKDIEDMCTVPILSEIIQDHTGEKVVVSAGRSNVLSEQFRTLKSNIQHFYNAKDKGRVSLFTSSLSGEGKSFLVTNLGMTLAVSGRRTIILEFDFKKPQIAKNLKLDAAAGLSDFLTKQATLEQIVQPSGLDKNLFVICAGSTPVNHAEIMENKDIQLLLLTLRTQYDDILIDSPPVFLVSDAMILGKTADLTVYVVRQAITTKAHLNYIESLQDEGKLPRMGIVFNGIQKGGKFGYYTNQDYSYYKAPVTTKAKLRAGFYSFLKRF